MSNAFAVVPATSPLGDMAELLMNNSEARRMVLVSGETHEHTGMTVQIVYAGCTAIVST